MTKRRFSALLMLEIATYGVILALMISGFLLGEIEAFEWIALFILINIWMVTIGMRRRQR